MVGCVLTSYTVTGCVNLSQTPLDPSRIDSSCIITQVPACGYESTVSVSVVPNSVLTASVSSTNRVNLAIQEISDNTLAGTYNFVVTATIPSYPYVTKPTATAPVTIVVVDPCTTSTIAAQTIPKIATFVGFTKSVGPFNFVDTVTTNYAARGSSNFCGLIDWTFQINGVATTELSGINNGAITFAPPTSINPGNKRNANLRAALTNYPLIYRDNPYEVVAYTATLATPKDQNYTVGDPAKSFLIETNTIFTPENPSLPFQTKW